MAAALDRAVFYGSVRSDPFPKALSQGQVAGMGSLFDACPPDLSTDALAYCLATAFHETARTMLPVKEYGGAAYYTRMYDPQGDRPTVAKSLGNTVPGDGAKFAGRGYVQLTGRSNYRRATGELQNRGYLDRSLDLTVTPDMAMTPDIAAAILFLGMQEGWFTGRKLADYFGPGKSGPVGARAIINGQDKASTIAGYFRAFQTALAAAGHVPGGVAVVVPTVPVETKPVAPPPAAPAPAPAPRQSDVNLAPAPRADDPKPTPGLFARMAERLRIAFPVKKV